MDATFSAKVCAGHHSKNLLGGTQLVRQGELLVCPRLGRTLQQTKLLGTKPPLYILYASRSRPKRGLQLGLAPGLLHSAQRDHRGKFARAARRQKSTRH